MRDRCGERFPDALFRLLAGYPRFDAAALIDTRADPPRPVAVSPAMLAMRPPDARHWQVPPLPAAAAGRIDPSALGLDARFAAAAPIVGPDGGPLGCLVVADRRERRLTPALARALADVAELAAPLLPQPADRPPRAADGAATLHRSVRPRATAERLIAAALERHAAGPAGLMVLDLDRFRAVNEALGSAAGDALLAVTGARLQAAIGPGGFLLRLDGDRFVIVAPGDQRTLAALARRLLRRSASRWRSTAAPWSSRRASASSPGRRPASRRPTC